MAPSSGSSVMRCRSPSQVHKMFKEVTCPFPTMDTFAGPYGAVNYSLKGPPDGETIVCFHGLNAARTMFDVLANTLSKEGYRVLTFDLYGHGLSNAPGVNMWPCRSCRRGCPCGAPRGKYDLDFFVEQTDALLNYLGMSNIPLTLIGFSLGGAVAVKFAEDYPDRVRRIVALSPAGFLPKLPKLYYLLRTTWCCLVPLASTLVCRFWYSKERFRRGMPGAEEAAVTSLWSRFVWSLFVKRGVASASLAIMLRVRWAGLAPMYRKVGSHKRPVLLIWGNRDQLNPVPQSPEAALACFSNAGLVVIDDAGHMVITDRPRQSIQAIYDFLQLPETVQMSAPNAPMNIDLSSTPPDPEVVGRVADDRAETWRQEV